MRIVELGKYYPPDAGGIENNTRHCALELAKDHDVHVVVFNQEHKTVEEVIDGVPVTRVASLGNIARQEVAPGLVRVLRHLKPDVTHLHAPNPMAMLAYLVATPHVPVIVTHHTDIIKQRALTPLVLPVYRKVLERAQAIILYTMRYGVTSPEVQAFASRFVIIPHGTDARLFTPAKTVERDAASLRCRLAGSGPTALFLGRHVHYKGIDILLQALTRVPDVHALIGGDGPLLATLRDQAVALGVGARAHVLGKLNDEQKVVAFYASDFVVLPFLNRTESYGQVQVEAQLCRRPVIVSDVNSGVTDVTRHEQTGLVVPPGDVSQLAAAMRRLADEPALRHCYGASGARRAHAMFVDRVTGPKVRQLFREIEARLGARSPQRSTAGLAESPALITARAAMFPR